MPTKRSTFIGIDLSDLFTKRKRPCARATIGKNLNCIFDEWEYDLTGNQIVPDEIPSTQFVLAVDGPQGLAGNPEYTMRFGERKLGAYKSPQCADICPEEAPVPDPVHKESRDQLLKK